jgi:hypothetical protein
MENYKDDFIRKISDFISLPYYVFSKDDEPIINEYKLNKIKEYTELFNEINKNIDFLYRNEDYNTLIKSSKILQNDIDTTKNNVKELQNDSNSTYLIDCLNIKINELESFKEKIDTYIESIENSDSYRINDTKDNKRPLTDHQIVLFFHYIFDQLAVYSKADKTKITQVVLKITGKDVDPQKVKDTNLYKMFKDVLGYYKTTKDSDSKTLQQNLHVVKKMLESLNIDTKDIVNDINSNSK